MKQKGFTLVELIVVMTITAILGVIFTNILTQTLRGQNKVQVLNRVKQNSQTALDRIASDIRQAEEIVCPLDNIGPNEAIVVNKDGNFTRYRLIPPVTGSPSVGGYIAWDNPATNTGTLCVDSIVDANKRYLTDTDPVNGISVDKDGINVFDVNKSDGYNDIVTINFKAIAATGSGSTYESMVKDGGISFSTSVELKGRKN